MLTSACLRGVGSVRAFTLIEIMVSVAILAIIAASGIQSWHRANIWLTEETERSRATTMLASAAETVRTAAFVDVPPSAKNVWLPSGVPGSVEIPATDGEARHVGLDGMVPLDNVPLRQLIGVDVLEARGMQNARGEVRGAAIYVPEAAGKAVRVRYLGRFRILARGTSVDDDLHPGGANKLVTLQVYDGATPIPALTATVLRMQP